MVEAARYFGALVATNLRASMALRGAFWTRTIFMFANNFIYLVMWWAFFDEFEEVRGWKLPDMLAIYGVAASVFGLAVILGAGVLTMARTIVQGDLDTFLTQPKPTVIAVVASRSEASGWGDVASAVVLFALSGLVAPASIPFVIVAVLCGCAVFLSSAVIFHSIAFWLRDTEALSRHFVHFLLAYAAFPKTVFVGMLKVALFTIVPAGFITFLPVDVVRGGGWDVLAMTLGGVAIYAGIAAWVFRRGLRRYESGNRFGVRA